MITLNSKEELTTEVIKRIVEDHFGKELPRLQKLERYYKNDNDILMTANQKLTDWVNKIINEVGIYAVEDRRTVTIPICKNPRRVIAGKWDDIKDGMPEFLSQEEIIIPEIRFIRMK